MKKEIKAEIKRKKQNILKALLATIGQYQICKCLKELSQVLDIFAEDIYKLTRKNKKTK